MNENLNRYTKAELISRIQFQKRQIESLELSQKTTLELKTQAQATEEERGRQNMHLQEQLRMQHYSLRYLESEIKKLQVVLTTGKRTPVQ